ncbi:hypothetical protein LCGC14_1239470 [marine sediment metagenome]|uniref:Uncharacterized protein n=1 Tax=marine sediment metagenome TaxID=412755 RepID=A0A0F9PAF1_9ZZZZ
MPAVKSLDKISEKWARVASVSQPDYIDGIQNPRADWAQQTAAAAGNYNSAVTKAIQEKRFEKGVTKAGTPKWQERSLAVGPDRWLQGIQLSKNAYETGFAPFRQVIINTTLPPRGAKGDPKNIQRVAVLADALHKEKLARLGQ